MKRKRDGAVSARVAIMRSLRSDFRQRLEFASDSSGGYLGSSRTYIPADTRVTFHEAKPPLRLMRVSSDSLLICVSSRSRKPHARTATVVDVIGVGDSPNIVDIVGDIGMSTVSLVPRPCSSRGAKPRALHRDPDARM